MREPAGADPSGRPTVSRRTVLGASAGAAAVAMLGTPPAHAGEATSTAGNGIVRTPDVRFRDLPDYPFAANHVKVGTGGRGPALRMHYVDERPRDGGTSAETVVLLHGNPAWSYLYRHVIPPLAAAGHRCVAPDLIGFGRSDKLTDRFAYTYQSHVDWLAEALFDRLDLRDVTLVCHDWGGLIGLRLLAEHPDRFRRAVASNTRLEAGGRDLGPGWRHIALWQRRTQRTEHLDVGGIVDEYSATGLGSRVRAAYNAPFPEDAHLHGVRRFALLFPITEDDEANAAIDATWQVLRTLEIPFLCVFGARDHVTGGDHAALSDHIPGAQGMPHAVLDGAHFVQEDDPAGFAAAVDGFIRTTP